LKPERSSTQHHWSSSAASSAANFSGFSGKFSQRNSGICTGTWFFEKFDNSLGLQGLTHSSQSHSVIITLHRHCIPGLSSFKFSQLLCPDFSRSNTISVTFFECPREGGRVAGGSGGVGTAESLRMSLAACKLRQPRGGRKRGSSHIVRWVKTDSTRE
jgi:hypothetical protein